MENTKSQLASSNIALYMYENSLSEFLKQVTEQQNKIH